MLSITRRWPMRSSIRCFTTSTAATRVAAEFLERTRAPPRVQCQYLDANQLQRLGATLNRPALAKGEPPTGTLIPPGYHLGYFTPSQVEAELGDDGTDTTFNPPAPFTRRMWAGGKIVWPDSSSVQMQVGQTVREVTKVLSAEPKMTKAGEEMVVVGVQKEYTRVDSDRPNEVLMLDQRNWIFRPALGRDNPPKPTPAGPSTPFPIGAHTRDLLQTPVTLFRFSALTFNGHKIHYSKEWCQEVEGHRNIVVHGPLNLVNILDFWNDTFGGSSRLQSPWSIRSIAYRATHPVYADEKYRIVMDDMADNTTSVRIVDASGNICMAAKIEGYL